MNRKSLSILIILAVGAVLAVMILQMDRPTVSQHEEPPGHTEEGGHSEADETAAERIKTVVGKYIARFRPRNESHAIRVARQFLLEIKKEIHSGIKIHLANAGHLDALFGMYRTQAVFNGIGIDQLGCQPGQSKHYGRISTMTFARPGQ